MPWYAIVRKVVRSNESWQFAGPLGEPGQLAQPAPVVIPSRSFMPWRSQQPTTINPTSWVDGSSNTVWYFPGRFNVNVDPLGGPSIFPTPVVTVTDAWGWWARFRGPRGNSSRTFSGERPTQIGARLFCHQFIQMVDALVQDADILDTNDLEV